MVSRNLFSYRTCAVQDSSDCWSPFGWLHSKQHHASRHKPDRPAQHQQHLRTASLRSCAVSSAASSLDSAGAAATAVLFPASSHAVTSQLSPGCSEPVLVCAPAAGPEARSKQPADTRSSRDLGSLHSMPDSLQQALPQATAAVMAEWLAQQPELLHDVLTQLEGLAMQPAGPECSPAEQMHQLGTQEAQPSVDSARDFGSKSQVIPDTAKNFDVSQINGDAAFAGSSQAAAQSVAAVQPISQTSAYSASRCPNSQQAADIPQRVQAKVEEPSSSRLGSLQSKAAASGVVNLGMTAYANHHDQRAPDSISIDTADLATTTAASAGCLSIGHEASDASQIDANAQAQGLSEQLLEHCVHGR